MFQPQWPSSSSSSGYPPVRPPTLRKGHLVVAFSLNAQLPTQNGEFSCTCRSITLCDWLLLHADCLDLLFSVGLGLERRRPNLDPGCLGRASFDDLALLRRLLLDDVVVGARCRHQKPYGGCRQGQFLEHCFLLWKIRGGQVITLTFGSPMVVRTRVPEALTMAATSRYQLP